MRRVSWTALAVTVASILTGVITNLATGTVVMKQPWWAWVLWSALAGLSAVLVVVDQIRARNESPPPPGDAAAPLVARVREVLRAHLRHAERPVMMPVRWRLLAEPFCDQASNVQRAWIGNRPPELPQSGRLEQVASAYGKVCSRRLVILGDPGAGKTTLAARLAEDLLALEDGTSPRIPVLVSLGSWDPSTVSLNDWLTVRIVEEYLPKSPHASSIAASVMNHPGLLPVLDGFDEMAAPARMHAIKQLNQDPAVPFVLTSRRAEFSGAVESTGRVLEAAACIELDRLDAEEAAEYLRRSPGNDSSRRWDPVLTRLAESRGSPGVAAIQDLLTMPLTLALAGAVYADARSDPAQLLTLSSQGGRKALEDHLIDRFVEIAYERAGRGSHADRATMWLARLAGHLRSLGTQDISWWRLGESLRPPDRLLAFAVFLGVLNGLSAGVIALVTGTSPVFALFGLASGPVLVALLSRLFLVTPHPDLIRLRLTPDRVRQGLKLSVPGGCLIGLMVGSISGSVTLGFQYGALSAVVGFLAVIVTDRRDANAIAAPRDLLRSSRTNALALLVLSIAVIWPVLWLMDRLGPGAVMAVPVGLLGTAWMRWIVLARVWLPLTGRLPWRLHTFLEEAHRLGLLRQVGSAYQFRHVILQERLSTRVPGDSGTLATPAMDVFAARLRATTGRRGPTTLTNLARDLDADVEQLRRLLTGMTELGVVQLVRTGPEGTHAVNPAEIAAHARFQVNMAADAP